MHDGKQSNRIRRPIIEDDSQAFYSKSRNR